MIVSKYLEHSHDLRFNMQRDNRAKQNTNTPKPAHTHPYIQISIHISHLQIKIPPGRLRHHRSNHVSQVWHHQ